MGSALDLLLTRQDRQNDATFENDIDRKRSEEFEERFQRVSSMDFKAPRCSKLIKGIKDTKKENDYRETAPMTIEAFDDPKESQ